MILYFRLIITNIITFKYSMLIESGSAYNAGILILFLSTLVGQFVNTINSIQLTDPIVSFWNHWRLFHRMSLDFHSQY